MISRNTAASQRQPDLGVGALLGDKQVKFILQPGVDRAISAHTSFITSMQSPLAKSRG
ncbi:MAG: hypothetical protein RL367_2496 [Pseudomonadota bacterium]